LLLITAGYWSFTLTDGALRMLVLLHFHDLGYSPVSLAFLFLLYEVMGIATNLVGGWVGGRFGLHKTLIAGLTLQVAALLVLAAQQPNWAEWLSVAYVMGAQGLSGVAKDLTKLSSKASVKRVASEGALFAWVAALTGSKNALKGVGFFVGSVLLTAFGFRASLVMMAGVLGVVAALVGVLIGRGGSERFVPVAAAKSAGSLRSSLSKSEAINDLSVARFFLFGARDIWFVVALPVFLADELGWSFQAIGGFLAVWVIGYGLIQTGVPILVRRTADRAASARRWALLLAGITGVLATLVSLVGDGAARPIVVVAGLVVFGAAFAVNSSLHSFLILAYSTAEDAAADVGFYYSANAAGRLFGTLMSGLLFLWGGLEVALWGAALSITLAWVLSLRFPSTT
jgi:predicted MFS family arabinose efflux permease